MGGRGDMSSIFTHNPDSISKLKPYSRVIINIHVFDGGTQKPMQTWGQHANSEQKGAAPDGM